MKKKDEVSSEKEMVVAMVCCDKNKIDSLMKELESNGFKAMAGDEAEGELYHLTDDPDVVMLRVSKDHYVRVKLEDIGLSYSSNRFMIPYVFYKAYLLLSMFLELNLYANDYK